MKIGLILECGPEGPDRKVCEQFARKLDANVQLEFVTLDDKRRLIEGCGRAAVKLFDAGCNRVVIVWDLYPAWRAKGERPCRAEDRTAILKSQRASGVDVARVGLVCITGELEAWLLADNNALRQYLSIPAHPFPVTRNRQPDRTRSPKKVMRKFFNDSRHGDYRDYWHAGEIARLVNVERLRGIDSFDRFARFVTGV